jgi:hypothetical protein
VRKCQRKATSKLEKPFQKRVSNWSIALIGLTPLATPQLENFFQNTLKIAKNLGFVLHFIPAHDPLKFKSIDGNELVTILTFSKRRFFVDAGAGKPIDKKLIDSIGHCWALVTSD